MNKLCLIIPALLISLSNFAQSKKNIEVLAASPKRVVDLPIDYMCAFPSETMSEWDKGYRAYKNFITPAVEKTQLGMAYEYNGIHTWFIMPAAKAHVELDSMTRIFSNKQLYGVWRSVKNRYILFDDSATYNPPQLYRSSKLVSETDSDDVFIVFTESKYEMFVKEAGKKSFKKISSNYSIENGRYLMLYKILKASAGISIIGIDIEGRLILHSNRVIERKIPGVYITYEAGVTQMVFEKVN